MNTELQETDVLEATKNVPLTPEMEVLLKELKDIVANPVVESAYNDAIANVQPILTDGSKNPWIGQPISFFVKYFADWFTYLPEPSGGLGKIMPFTYFYLENDVAFNFLNLLKSRRNDTIPYTKEIFNWTVEFIKVRGRFMDSPESLKYIQAWIDDPSTQIEDFIVPKGGYKSFNEFFTRELKPSANARPISDPNDDEVVVASADSEINFIESDLTLKTKLNVKTRQINVNELLKDSKYAKHFVGGTAISCVLMPNNYHRYHAPVTGKIVESQEVMGIYNGIMDGEDWFNSGNIGESTTDFSIFEDFHRAYFVMETKKYGYVAMIPVGLNTISAIFPSLVNNESTMVPPGAPAVDIKKGQELGHFAYGGSLNILLFQKNVFSSISVLMGQRLGEMSAIKNN
jgi:phosphatidylserine decarboxylase